MRKHRLEIWKWGGRTGPQTALIIRRIWLGLCRSTLSAYQKKSTCAFFQWRNELYLPMCGSSKIQLFQKFVMHGIQGGYANHSAWDLLHGQQCWALKELFRIRPAVLPHDSERTEKGCPSCLPDNGKMLSESVSVCQWLMDKSTM